MKDFSAKNSKTGSFSVKKRLEEVVEELNKEVKEADEMWNGLNYTVHQQIDEVCCVFDTFQSIFFYNVSVCFQAETSEGPATKKRKRKLEFFCLAVSRDNWRILSGGWDEKVLIHDVNT